MSAPNILLVEGTRTGSDSLEAALLKEDYQVIVFHAGKSAGDWARSNQPDLVLVDAASMRSSGVRSCRQLRRLLGDVPIIHTRPIGENQDDNAGADAYLMMPFTSRKVLNRVRALLPADHFSEEIVRAGDLTLIRSKPSVEVRGQREKRLTPKQAQLLEEFLRHPNEVLSRRQLMQNVWNTDYIGDTRTLDVHMRWVREAIENNASDPERITTVRGIGYIFKLPPEKSETGA